MLRYLFYLLVWLIPVNINGLEGWTHLELGAANYGEKTLNRPPFDAIEPLTDFDRQIYSLDPHHGGRLGLLFWTLEELVKRYGNEGLFHLNDKDPDAAQYVAAILTEYAKEKGYNKILIEPLPGDFKKLNAAAALAPYSRQLYDSVHLKNPEPMLYCRWRHDEVDGKEIFTQLAALSSKGCFIFLCDFAHSKPGNASEEEFEDNAFFKSTKEWPRVPYVSPKGKVISETFCEVFFISCGL